MIISTYLRGQYPFEHYQTLPPFTNSHELLNSIQKLRLPCTVITNEKLQDVRANVYKVNNTPINPIDDRWKCILQYLEQEQPDNFFHLDLGDTAVLQNPFPKIKPGIIYIGGEDVPIEKNPWLIKRYRQIGNLGWFYKEFAKMDTLNPGILGGYLDDVMPLIQDCVNLLDGWGIQDKTVDMNAFNYLIYTKYQYKICSGPPLNTKFKAYRKNNKECWIRHK